MIKLYDYPRSSAAYRVRIALAIKGLPYDSAEVHLLRGGGEQHGAAYRTVNPAGLVPSLEVDGAVLTQSLAIIEYLDERYPTPPLLPSAPLERARVRALALTIAADTHPVQNLRLGTYLRSAFSADDAAVLAWNRHWIELGLAAFQALLLRENRPGPYSCGDKVTLADICLAPQMINGRRYGCDFGPFARLMEIDAALRALPSFATTSPENIK